MLIKNNLVPLIGVLLKFPTINPSILYGIQTPRDRTEILFWQNRELTFVTFVFYLHVRILNELLAH